MRRLFTILAAIFFTTSLFAYQGKLSGEKNIKVIQTKYFKIMYPESCIESAALLYENADRIYEEVAASFNGREPYLKLPVVLTSKTEKYQGIYDDLPYPKILVSDTARRDETINNEDDVLTNFRHEITHTYSRTVRSPMWKAFGFDFGFFWTTTGITEGEAIVSESLDGKGGRLNDEYFKHIVKQAKIEGKFPKFSDVQGPYDAYRPDAYKNFNAMFTKYIQEKHGMEKYFQWLWKMTNLRTFTVRQAFRKFYGVGLNEEWKNFCDSLDFSFVETDFLGEKFGISEFLNSQRENKSGMLISTLQKCDRGFYFLDKDSSCVYFLEGAGENLKKVFYKENIDTISVSADGKFIAVSYDSDFASNTRAKLAVLDTKAKKWHYFSESGLFNSAIVYVPPVPEALEGQYYILSTTYDHHAYKTKIFRLDFSEKKAKLVENAKIVFGDKQFPVCYCGIDGGFAFVFKDGKDFSICTADFSGGNIKQFSTSSSNIEGLFIKQLSSSDGKKLSFSYTEKDSFPRLGFFDIETGEISFDKTDFSGGVFSPVVSNDEIVYVGNFYRDSKIFSRKISNIVTEKSHVSARGTAFGGKTAAPPENLAREGNETETLDATGNSPATDDQTVTLLKNSKKITAPQMYNRYMFIPFALTATRDFVPGPDAHGHNSKAGSTTYWNMWGFSLFGADPWEESHLNMFAGYGFETNSVVIKAQYASGTGNELFKYDISSNTELDSHAWKLSNLKVKLKSTMPLERNSTLVFAVDSFTQFGRRNEKNYTLDVIDDGIFNIFDEMDKYAHSLGLKSAQSADLSFYLYNTNEFKAQYSFVEKFGNGRYEKAGFSLGADLYYILNERTAKGYKASTKQVYEERLDLGFDVTAYFPGFSHNVARSNMLTYTAPAKFIFSLFPMDIARAMGASMYMGSIGDAMKNCDLIFTAYGEIILFATEIQKAIPGIQIAYLNDMKISLTAYDFLFDAADTRNSPYFHSYKQFSSYCSGSIPLENWFLLGLRAELGLSANLGVFCGTASGRFFTEAVVGVAGTNSFNWSIGFELDY